MKNNIFNSKNSKGFTIVFLLLILPTLLTFLAILYNLVMLIEFKSEFRFKCIKQSLALQQELLKDPTNSLQKSTELLEILKAIKYNVSSEVTLSDYPKYETGTHNDSEKNLVYRLNYSWLSNLYSGNLSCGAKLIKKEGLWHNKIVYSTNTDKF